MKRKPLIIISSILFTIILLYCGVWFCYYQFVWMPHVQNATQKLTSKKDDTTHETKYYAPMDDLGDTYYISIPSFGDFNCFIASYPSIIMDESMPMVDENGNTTYATYVENGCPFWCAMSAYFGVNGTIKEYRFDVSPCPEPADYANSPYAAHAFLLISPDGDLLNEDELSNKEITIYNDVRSELVRVIEKTNSIFNIN